MGVSGADGGVASAGGTAPGGSQGSNGPGGSPSAAPTAAAGANAPDAAAGEGEVRDPVAHMVEEIRRGADAPGADLADLGANTRGRHPSPLSEWLFFEEMEPVDAIR
eukprot:9780750-Alexandrium_andersonii.AAC.1